MKESAVRFFSGGQGIRTLAPVSRPSAFRVRPLGPLE